ncbi:type I secretion system permease/ATPase, partial [Pseudomonas sp. HMWF031]
MTSSQTNTLQGLLARFSAFRNLEPDDLTWLAERAKPYHCSIGQELLSAERMPEICYCILEGRGRVLHSDPGLQRPVTLAYAQPGDLVGWSGLVRRSPCEWITAVTPMKMIGFSAADFQALEQRSAAFAGWLDANNSPAELMAVLAPALRRRPQAEPPERDVLRRLLPGLQLIPAREQRQLPLHDGAIWLWNAQPDAIAVPVGSSVESHQLALIPPGSSLRLLRIDAELWERELNPVLEHPEEQQVSTLADPWSADDRYSELMAPPPQGERRDEAALSTLMETQDQLRWKGRRIPVVTGSGPLEQAMACLEMLSLYHSSPFR